MSNNSKKIARVLIVDDNPVNTKFLEKLLKKQSYQVWSAQNGLEACQIAEKVLPDMVLLDIMMPIMDGFDACRKLKETPVTSDISVIFLTSKADIKDILNGFRLGAVDYITKPFKPKELLARISTHLRLKFAQDTLKKVAILDKLTQLYNPNYINKRLTQEISEAHRHTHPLCIFMFDLDHFKKINDVYGYDVGNDVFVKISATLKMNLRKEDIIGRYGGDEFIVILPNTIQRDGYTVADHIRGRIGKMNWNHNGMKVTISGGVTAMRKEKSAKELISRTDVLLCQAKTKGRDTIIYG